MPWGVYGSGWNDLAAGAKNSSVEEDTNRRLANVLARPAGEVPENELEWVNEAGAVDAGSDMADELDNGDDDGGREIDGRDKEESGEQGR